MIRHCVFIRFRQNLPEAERTSILSDVVALKPLIPGLIAVHLGANVSPETGMDKGFSDGFIVDFDGPAARDAYLIHPEHRKVGGRIVAASAGGVEGVIVYDLDIPG